MSFSERLVSLQRERNVDKKAVYEAAGLSRMTYWRYENGEREPPLSVLAAIADFFNVSLDYLAGRSNNSAPFRLA